MWGSKKNSQDPLYLHGSSEIMEKIQSKRKEDYIQFWSLYANSNPSWQIGMERKIESDQQNERIESLKHLALPLHWSSHEISESLEWLWGQNEEVFVRGSEISLFIWWWTVGVGLVNVKLSRESTKKDFELDLFITIVDYWTQHLYTWLLNSWAYFQKVAFF